MTNEQKEFIKNAKDTTKYGDIENYEFKELYVIDSENQFENLDDYNEIVIVGFTFDEEYILITDFSDVYSIKDKNDLDIPFYRTDVPRQLGCIRHFILSTKYCFKVAYLGSDCDFEVAKRCKI